MTYLRVREFWEYQNADAWKKALAAKKSERRYPTWCKLVVRRDRDMDTLPIATRLLYLELLRLAVEHTNVIPNDSEWIAKQISMTPGAVTKGITELLKGAWIQETKSNRLSREFLETFASRSRSRSKKKEEEVEVTSPDLIEHQQRLDNLVNIKQLTAKVTGSLGA